MATQLFNDYIRVFGLAQEIKDADASQIFNRKSGTSLDSDHIAAELTKTHPEFSGIDLAERIFTLENEWYTTSPLNNGGIFRADYIAVKLIEELLAVDPSASE